MSIRASSPLTLRIDDLERNILRLEHCIRNTFAMVFQSEFLWDQRELRGFIGQRVTWASYIIHGFDPITSSATFRSR